MEQESTEQKSTELKSTEPASTGLKSSSNKETGLKKKSQKSGKKKTKRKKKKSSRKISININLDAKSLLLGIAAGILGVLLVMAVFSRCSVKEEKTSGLDIDASEPEISVQLLDLNDYSRPGTEADPITGIVIHYTANPGSTAQQNRDYFNGLQDGHGTSVSSHFVVGLDGEIVQCVPTWEVAYASNERNHDTISIECCHPDATGKFTDATYVSIVRLTAFLCAKYELNADAVIRHYDVTGKNCPKYFVENEDAWVLFKADVNAALEKGTADSKED